MNRLLILSPEAEEYAAHIQAAGLAELDVFAASSPEQAEPLLGQVNLLMGLPAWIAPLLKDMPLLEWVQSTSAGVNEFCPPNLRRDYQLTNVRDVFGSAMSEYVFAYMLAIERQMMRLYQAQRQHQWIASEQLSYRCLHELTLGVIGLGSIGSHIAATGAHFGMRVLGVRREPQPTEHVEQVFGIDELEQFLPQLDYLVMVLPDASSTHHFMNAERLALLRPDAVLLNVGRGITLDEAALLQALQQKRLQAAVLDVFAQEPLPAEHPLWDHPDILITPHNSALSFARQITGIFIKNYQRYQSGQALQYRIDFARGY
ncbi:MAG: D-2-hydroxyacid dehydrogenase [Thiolinea sp.]